MAFDTRQRMVGAASELFRERGFDGTGFRDVVDRAGAARGAIYHHFPEGKTELGVSVVGEAGGRIATLVEDVCAAAAPTQAVETLLDIVGRMLVHHGDRPGCPVTAVTLAADDPTGALRAAADTFFDRLDAALADCLMRAGISDDQARAFATLAVSAAEGAIILCRAADEIDPLARVRQALLTHVAMLTPAPAPAPAPAPVPAPAP
jgi:TetR/AcrR family transcriptional regulator, lmrAB and yxaGH operons repressor